MTNENTPGPKDSPKPFQMDSPQSHDTVLPKPSQLTLAIDLFNESDLQKKVDVITASIENLPTSTLPVECNCIPNISVD